MSFLISHLKRIKEWYSWVSFGKMVIVITPKIVVEIIIWVGGLAYMPWYSHIGLVVASVGFLLLALDFYLQYKLKAVPFYEAIIWVEKSLKKTQKNIQGDKGLFLARGCSYSWIKKEIMAYLFEACQRGKITLFGRGENLPETEIDPVCIDSQRIVFKNNLPIILNYQNDVMFKDLAVDKYELLKWVKEYPFPTYPPSHNHPASSN